MLSFLWVRGVCSTLANFDLLPLCMHYARFGWHPWINHVAKQIIFFSYFAQSSYGLGFSDSLVVFIDPVVISDHAINVHFRADFTHLFPRFLGIGLC